MLRVLTGELSGLVEGGRPTKVTLLPNNPPFPGLESFLRSSDDLQTMVQNLAQTVISREENKVDSMVAVERFFFAKLSSFLPIRNCVCGRGAGCIIHG